MIALFDQHGRCREIHSDLLPGVEGRWPHVALVPEGTGPEDVWYDVAEQVVKPTEQVADADVVEAVAGEPLTVTVQPGCVLTMRGVEYGPGEVEVDTSAPGRILLSFAGSKTGRQFLIIQSYAELRAAEYPPVEDQLDALWKGGAEAEAMRATVAAVKAKHPKPA